jgi:hypothetical protein
VSAPRGLCILLAALWWPSAAFAQSWTFDARKIGVGNAGGTENLGSRMIDEQREYRSIVLPFGLLQVLRDLDVFRPGSGEFDIIKSVEYIAAPLHYVIGRDSTTSDIGRQFVVDVRNGTLSRDLNTYRGFVPVNQPPVEGLAFSTNGGTIKLYRGSGGAFHGLFVGAGQYLPMRITVDLDQRLIDILGSDTNVYVPNTQFRLGTATRSGLALALTGGYRARFALPADVAAPADAPERDGVYLAFNYNYLLGFRYEDIDTTLRLDTDSAGLLTINPTFVASPPVQIGRNHSSSGRGLAIDVGVGVVAGPLEAGFGINGIANRIDWTEVERTTYSLTNVFLGNGRFAESLARPVGDVRMELPLDYRANAGYRASTWSALGEFGRGYEGTSFHGGYEYRMRVLELRGGALFTRGRWQPTGGVGFNMGPRISLDVAMFGTSANVERKRHAAIAASLRFNRGVVQ